MLGDGFLILKIIGTAVSSKEFFNFGFINWLSLQNVPHKLCMTSEASQALGTLSNSVLQFDEQFLTPKGK